MFGESPTGDIKQISIVDGPVLWRKCHLLNSFTVNKGFFNFKQAGVVDPVIFRTVVLVYYVFFDLMEGTSLVQNVRSSIQRKLYDLSPAE